MGSYEICTKGSKDMGRNCGDSLGRMRRVKLLDAPHKMTSSKEGRKVGVEKGRKSRRRGTEIK
jgi:hypothetical protein